MTDEGLTTGDLNTSRGRRVDMYPRNVSGDAGTFVCVSVCVSRCVSQRVDQVERGRLYAWGDRVGVCGYWDVLMGTFGYVDVFMCDRTVRSLR